MSGPLMFACTRTGLSNELRSVLTQSEGAIPENRLPSHYVHINATYTHLNTHIAPIEYARRHP